MHDKAVQDLQQQHQGLVSLSCRVIDKPSNGVSRLILNHGANIPVGILHYTLCILFNLIVLKMICM